MNFTVKNILYDRPELYESLYPEIHEETPSMCRRIFKKFLKKDPSSILDVACGTGRDLRSLHRTCDECVGVDHLPGMIEHAKSQAPDVAFSVGDMRSIRLDRTFDVVLCFGSAILYALTNEDLDKTFATFGAHSHQGTLLILDLRNASAFLGDGFKARIEGDIHVEGLKAHWVAEHSLKRREQRLIRKRVWEIPGEENQVDYCEYRLLFPMELERLLEVAGFKLIGMFDNKELKESDFTGPTMYVVAERIA